MAVDQEQDVDEDEEDWLADVEEADDEIEQTANEDLSLEDICKGELESYIAAPRLKLNKSNDPLIWWKENQTTYPILAQLARIYLAVQATSAPSERIFSAAEQILSKSRARMTPAMAGKLFYVNRNWSWYFNQMSLEEALEGVEQEVDEQKCRHNQY